MNLPTQNMKPLTRVIWKYTYVVKEFDKGADAVLEWLMFHHTWLYDDINPNQTSETNALHTKLDKVADILTKAYKECPSSVSAIESAMEDIEDMDTLLPIMEHTFDLICQE